MVFRAKADGIWRSREIALALLKRGIIGTAGDHFLLPRPQTVDKRSSE